MALIKCPKCGKEISDKAEKCPHCGYPIEEIEKNTATKPDENNEVGNTIVAENKKNENSNQHEGKKSFDKKKIFFSIGVIIIVICIGIFLYSQIQLKENLENQKSKMVKLLEDIDTLKNEVYFDEAHNEEITILKNDSNIAFEERNLSAMETSCNKTKKLYDKIKKEIKQYNEYFQTITDELVLADKLSKDYFLKDYDVTKFLSVQENAKRVLENSDFHQYADVCKDLQSQNDLIENYINEFKEKCYSKQTASEGNVEFPFVVNTDEFTYPWSFEPMVKQNSKHPTWVLIQEADVTDKPPYANLFIDGSSSQYDFTVTQIPIKEISVQDKDGNLMQALVNTEIVFNEQGGYSDENAALNERPCYIFYDKENKLNLALQDYDGGDFYKLYISNSENFK